MRKLFAVMLLVLPLAGCIVKDNDCYRCREGCTVATCLKDGDGTCVCKLCFCRDGAK